MKTYDEVGGIEAFDQALALAIERLKELSTRSDLPKAFALAIPATNEDDEAAVELITTVPTDQPTEKQFVFMTMMCIRDWGYEILVRATEEAED